MNSYVFCVLVVYRRRWRKGFWSFICIWGGCLRMREIWSRFYWNYYNYFVMYMIRMRDFVLLFEFCYIFN